MGDTTYLSPTWSPSGTFEGNPYLGSLRGKDPKRTTTVTMHVPQQFDENGRCPGVRSHHFGAGMKVIGSELRYAYENRPTGNIKLSKSLDPAEILREYRTRTAPETHWDTAARGGPAETIASRLSQSHKFPPGTIRNTGRAVGQPAGSLSQTQAPTAGKLQSIKGGNDERKVVYWDGRETHIMNESEAPKVEAGQTWKPPHLEHADIAPGPFLGVVETPGSPNMKLVGSKHRLMPTRTGTAPSGGTRPLYSSWVGPNKGPYGVAPYAPTHKLSSYGPPGTLDEDSLRAYAYVKSIGHREYEESCKSMEGLNCWEHTQNNLTTSMAIGRPSRLTSPMEHTMTRLSLRRPTTSHF